MFKVVKFIEDARKVAKKINNNLEGEMIAYIYALTNGYYLVVDELEDVAEDTLYIDYQVENWQYGDICWTVY